MTINNDLRVAEILARGVSRLRATRIAINEAAKDDLEPVAENELLDRQRRDESQVRDTEQTEASR